MPLHLHIHDSKLKCPYTGCGKTFDKPTVLTDTSTMPRETYYACPHCMSKINVITENSKVVNVKATDYPRVFDSPAKCPRHLGFLNAMPEESPIPDECLVCPKVLQCSIRKK